MSESGKTPEQKLADALQGAKPKSAAPESAVEPEEQESDFAQAETLDQSRGFRISRDLFVFLAIGLFGFSIYEAYSNQLIREGDLAQLPFDSVQKPVLAERMSLSESIELFDKRRIFGEPSSDAPKPGPTIRGWRAELRQHWVLKGTSAISDLSEEDGYEAIVFDNRSKRLQFLRSGQTVNIADQDVEVVRVDAQRVELRRGEEVYVLD